MPRQREVGHAFGDLVRVPLVGDEDHCARHPLAAQQMVAHLAQHATPVPCRRQSQPRSRQQQGPGTPPSGQIDIRHAALLAGRGPYHFDAAVVMAELAAFLEAESA